MFELPITIRVGATDYPIRNKGDYRMVLDCFQALNDEELEMSSRVLCCLIIFYDNVDSPEDIKEVFGDNLNEAVLEMYKFFNCGQVEDNHNKTSEPLVDWEADAQLICGAINTNIKQEVRALEYLHWWTFMGYYLGIGKSAFATVVDIRNKVQKGKKLEKYEEEFKKNNPQYFRRKVTKDEQDFTDYLRSVWDNGGGK